MQNLRAPISEAKANAGPSATQKSAARISAPVGMTSVGISATRATRPYNSVIMKALASLFLLLFAGVSLHAQTTDHSAVTKAAATPDANERLGTVSFSVSCAPASQAEFNRGIALLHDFWYAEAEPQFNRIAKSDPTCAMAHWGVAMSMFHQIWDRPDPDVMKAGWAEMEKAQRPAAGTERERDYIAALADFYRPGDAKFPERVAAYSAAMGRLYAKYPGVNAGAFYALSLLAAESPDDTALSGHHKAMAVLTPLFAKDPANPGVLHYIIHSCDNPAMAADGLAAANHYGEVAPSGPHAFHMPGHIYSRLGLWPQDIASQRGSIAASQTAEAHGESGVMDEPHSYDFMIYASLQSGQDARAKAAIAEAAAPINTIEKDGMGGGHMGGMVPYYRTKLPVFYALEMRDWKSAAALEPVAGSPPEVSQMVYWARAVAHGHLHQAEQARADLAKYDELTVEIKKGSHAYYAEGNVPKIQHSEILAWAAFAAGKRNDALTNMRAAAGLQDKVGQQEVDIPAREMLADMLLEFGDAKGALAEYKVALRLSPNRFNGLYGAGMAAEKSGEKQQARMYYAALLKSTDDGANSSRSEIAHAKSFVAGLERAAK
jgi:tetratricopeptide (TPR) repeat protein